MQLRLCDREVHSHAPNAWSAELEVSEDYQTRPSCDIRYELRISTTANQLRLLRWRFVDTLCLARTYLENQRPPMCVYVVGGLSHFFRNHLC